MNNKCISYLVLTLFSSLSWLHSQSVNLDYANRAKIEKLANLCFVGEIDLSNKTVGAVIQKEWNIKVVPTIIILKEGKEVMRYEPGISMRFDQDEVFNKIKQEIK